MKLPDFDMSFFDFITTNPMFIVQSVIVALIVLLYSTSSYRMRRFYFFAYTINLSSQLDQFVDGLATSIVHVLRFSHAPSPQRRHLQTHAYSIDSTIQETFDALFHLTKLIVETESDEQFKKDLNQDISTDNSMIVKKLRNGLKASFRYTFNTADNDNPAHFYYAMHILKCLLLVYCDFDNTFSAKDKMKKYLKKHNFITDFNYLFEIKNTPSADMSTIMDLLTKISPSHDSDLDSSTLLSSTTFPHNIHNHINLDKTITNYLDSFSEDIKQIYFENLTTILKEHGDVDVKTLLNTDYDVELMQRDIYFKSWYKVLLSVRTCIEHIVNEETSDESSDSVARSLASTNLEIVKDYFKRDTLLLKEHTLQSIIDSINDGSNTLRTLTDNHFQQHKSNLHDLQASFESVLYQFQSMSGPGLLMMKFIDVDSVKYDIVKIVNNFNKLMTLHDVDQNRYLVAKAWSLYTNTDLEASEKNKILARTSQFYTALANIQLHMTVNFPRLLYYDTRRNPDKKRLKRYYKQLLDGRFEYLNDVLNVIPDIPVKPFTDHEITLHKPLNFFLVNVLIENIIQPFRDYLRAQWKSFNKNFSKFVFWIFRISMDGYTNNEPKENYITEESEKDYINEDGDVIEQFIPGLSKIANAFSPMLKKVFGSSFGPVFKVIDPIVKVIDTLYNPTKLFSIIGMYIKIVIKFSIGVTIAIVLLLEGILKLPTGILVFIITLGSTFLCIVVTIVLIVLIILLEIIDVTYTDGLLTVTLYKWILATENDIDQWKYVPSFEIGNEVNRPQIISACAPCTESYVPGDLFCERIPDYIPRYSPHANVYKILEGHRITGLTEPGELEMDLKFVMLPRHERKKIIEKYTKDVIDYHMVSNSKMKPYDPFLKNTCRHMSTYDLNHKDRKLVESICHSTFCRNGRYGSFCPKLRASNPYSTTHQSSLLENYVFLVGYLIMFIVVVVLIYYVNYKADLNEIKDYIMRTSGIVTSFFSKIRTKIPKIKNEHTTVS